MGFSVNRRNSLRSPHVRGKAQRRLHQLHQLGITPACAGKRSTLLCAPPRSRDHPRACGEKRVRGKVHLRHNANLSPEDHPRVCGEKCTNVCRRTHHKGSPPRVRGKANVANPAFNVARITTACAGKSQNGLKKTADDRGSPPRVRGKAANLEILSARLGITPACAGKSCAIMNYDCVNGDHPRVCGEK